jgi:glucose 1-dehydrogenase/3-oxoacyl-[acyl-carrier protein] reductase
MDLRVNGNAALVTASSSGLGLASAKALAREGANVTICARGAEDLQAARDEADAMGDGDVLAIQADITDPDDVSNLVESTVAEFGGLDHLVTSAGGPPSGAFLDMGEKDWYAAYDLLVMSVVWCCEEAHPHLVESETGSIVNITSRSVAEVIDGLVLSNSVRRAVIGLMKTLSREFAPEVRVNAVLPGAHETSRIEELVHQAIERGEYDSYEEGLADWSEGIPLERVGDPDAFGDAVAFLASPRASFVTGASLPIDGGSMRS